MRERRTSNSAGKIFNAVLAIDPDRRMLKEARKKAVRGASTTNAKWQKGSSKTMNALKGPFKLVAMSQSFTE
jgi:ubiquinone/menaquinone biosynthesis C-methylase UbiE